MLLKKTNINNCNNNILVLIAIIIIKRDYVDKPTSSCEKLSFCRDDISMKRTLKNWHGAGPFNPFR